MNFEPKWIAWETTQECNLTCVHCRSNACLDKYKDLDFSTEQGFSVIDQIASFAKPCLVLSGGEPLLRSEIFKNLRDFKKYKGKCGNCEYIKICGGCRARAHFMRGDYLAEEPLCHYTPKQLRGETSNTLQSS
ncbi:4Fe-4S cluster-binding domain-containing protein [Cysteiniphilum litorale]|uniref:4Fe-4S cluster-binding domain-containing protein n=1 Tax=Cysteiniphilum litorale TaxID=2056700 RepID=UPI003F88322B